MNLSQFGGGVRSVQYGSISLSCGTLTNTATITAVGSKAVIIPLGVPTTVVDASIYTALTLTNSTTVTASRLASTQAVNVNFVIVDFI